MVELTALIPNDRVYPPYTVDVEIYPTTYDVDDTLLCKATAAVSTQPVSANKHHTVANTQVKIVLGQNDPSLSYDPSSSACRTGLPCGKTYYAWVRLL
jgi:hypothetical protein